MSQQHNPITCAQIDELLCDYIDGALAGEELASVEHHLAGCASCAELARDAAEAVEFLHAAEPVEPPDALVTHLMFQVPDAAQRNKRGFRDFLSGWLRPILQPRFAMGMAMTILSFSLLGRAVGLPDEPLSPSDLHPRQVWESVDDRVHRTWDRIVKYYDNLRVVIEIQSRLNEWTDEQEPAGQPQPGPGEMPTEGIEQQ